MIDLEEFSALCFYGSFEDACKANEIINNLGMEEYAVTSRLFRTYHKIKARFAESVLHTKYIDNIYISHKKHQPKKEQLLRIEEELRQYNFHPFHVYVP